MAGKGNRIGIIGTGAIGGYYGVMLARAGFDVHFLLRSEYTAVRDQGLQVNSDVHGPMRLSPVQAYADVADMPPCDWLLVGAKATALQGLAPLIVRAAADGAKVVLLQNGLDVEEGLRGQLPPSLHLLGGLCYICVNRAAPGVIRHQALGALDLGYHSGPAADAQAIVEAGAALFREAGIESRVMPDLAAARWRKLVWNVPYNGLSVVLRASTSALMTDPDSRALVQGLMAEVVLGARACGHDVPQGYAEQLFAMTERMPDYWPSMYHDFAEGRPLELEAIYAAPLARAGAAGCELPRMEALYRALGFIDRNR